ncbi:MAG TPA: YceI family protein [Thermoanaerobaculia bacterium]|nr:YceI family protein [Thermoanaerobaculia bacterium]
MTRRFRLSRIAAPLALLVAVFGLTATAPAMADTWSIDPAHTRVSFAVDHFFTPVQGSFEELDVTLAYDPENPSASKVTAKIPVASVATANAKRDDHLRSADWFEAAEHPYMTFESSTVRAVGEGRLVALGTLTIKGISREVTLPIEILGVREIPEEMQPMIGAKKVASFRAATSLDRSDYEVGVGSWAGTMVVSDTVDVEILAEVHAR